MFTGLIQAVGRLTARVPTASGARLTIDLGGLSPPPAIGASVAVNGACLTVTAREGGAGVFDAVAETVSRTTLGALALGARVNLEPALRAGEPLDGHIVQGHVDEVGTIRALRPVGGGSEFTVALPARIAPLVAEKGSVAVDGISLTVTRVDRESFGVAVIPHTLAHTALGDRRPGDRVNLEVDVLARYAARLLSFGGAASGRLSEAFLRENGFGGM